MRVVHAPFGDAGPVRLELDVKLDPGRIFAWIRQAPCQGRAFGRSDRADGRTRALPAEVSLDTTRRQERVERFGGRLGRIHARW
jgi:hypothetical protein